MLHDFGNICSFIVKEMQVFGVASKIYHTNSLKVNAMHASTLVQTLCFVNYEA